MNAERILVATIHPWNIQNAEEMRTRYVGRYRVDILTEPEGLNAHDLRSDSPRFIFFPHWSWKIPEEIFREFECILFHMTDLPYGRGGTPLQNLISRGLETTVISAIRVTDEIDAGPVYLKHPLPLCGSAEEIFIRASGIIFQQMIPEILERHPVPQPQKGEVITFRRRTPEESNSGNIQELKALYDHIRMLDAPGYPRAYLETDHLIVELSNASIHEDRIRADAWIRFKKGGQA